MIKFSKSIGNTKTSTIFQKLLPIQILLLKLLKETVKFKVTKFSIVLLICHFVNIIMQKVCF